MHNLTFMPASLFNYVSSTVYIVFNLFIELNYTILIYSTPPAIVLIYVHIDTQCNNFLRFSLFKTINYFLIEKFRLNKKQNDKLDEPKKKTQFKNSFLRFSIIFLVFFYGSIQNFQEYPAIIMAHHTIDNYKMN